MNTSPPNPGGWLESLRRIGESSLALLRSRFELFTVEWQEEKLRLFIFALAFWLWSMAGHPGVIALAVTVVAIAGSMVGAIWRKIRTGPTPFAQTVAEFRKDGECLRSDK